MMEKASATRLRRTTDPAFFLSRYFVRFSSGQNVERSTRARPAEIPLRGPLWRVACRDWDDLFSDRPATVQLTSQTGAV